MNIQAPLLFVAVGDCRSRFGGARLVAAVHVIVHVVENIIENIGDNN